MKALTAFFFVSAGLCIAYLLIILGYGGFGTSFWYVWILFAVLLSAMGIFSRSATRHKEDMPHFLPTFVFTSFAMGMLGFCLIMSMVIGASKPSDDTKADYCLVMGARVFSNGISRTLMYRLDKAYEVYQNNPDVTLVLSGGQDSGDAIPEAFAMYNYLSMKGVPHQKMLVESQNTSTLRIIRKASELISLDAAVRKIPSGPGERVWAEDYVPSVGIVTSDYHMFRSTILAKENGLTNLVSIPAQSDSVLFVHNAVRESAAIVKDFFMGNLIIDESHMPNVSFDRRKEH